jgi:hypothetical protein
MRRLFLVLCLTAVTAAALTATAAAKEGGIELSSTPFGKGPGEPWTGMLTVFLPEQSARLSPSITIRNLDTGETQTFGAQPAKVPTTPEAQSFVFEVVFPTEGRYEYSAQDGVTDREYTFPVVRITGSAATPVPGPATPVSPAAEGSFPLWPVVGGLAGAAILALAGLLALRRTRFAH